MLLIYPEGRVVVDTGDSLDLVHQLKRAMFNPVVAYFGHSLSPGGDVDIGGTLIEDELFRRTNICKTLRSDAFYPISVGEAIQSPRVMIFKDEKYVILSDDSVLPISVITIPEMREVPPLDFQGRIQGSSLDEFRNSVRLLFQVAAKAGHDTVVVAGIGRGQWRIPAKDMARVFSEVLNSDGYRDLFSRVQIICDILGGVYREQYQELRGRFMRDIRRDSINGE